MNTNPLAATDVHPYETREKARKAQLTHASAGRESQQINLTQKQFP
jgi:hypothetical protein